MSRIKLTGNELHMVRVEIYNSNQNEDFQRDIYKKYQSWIAKEINDYIETINCNHLVVSYDADHNGTIRTYLESVDGFVNGMKTLLHTYHLFDDWTENMMMVDLNVLEDIIKAQDTMKEENQYLLEEMIFERIDEILAVLNNRLNTLCDKATDIEDFFCNVYWTDYMQIAERDLWFDEMTFVLYESHSFEH